MSFDNITYRKSERKKLNISDNFTDCTDSMDSEDSSTTDFTNTCQSNIEQNQQILKLHQEIKKIRIELNTVLENVQKLCLEKQELIGRIENCEQKIIQLTHNKPEPPQVNRCLKTDISNNYDKRHRNSAPVQKNNTFENPIQQHQARNSVQAGAEKTTTTPARKGQTNDHITPIYGRTVAASFEDMRLDKVVTSKQTTGGASGINKRTIFILGDQQVKGLSPALILSRKNKWNDTYSVCALVKPNALSADILSYCDVLCKELKPYDKIVISVGSNDKNPYMLLRNLSLALHKLHNFHVYILQTETNNFLRQNKVNDTIFAVSRTFNNCTFIKTNINTRPQEYLTSVVKSLNLKIDSHDYDKQYLSLKTKHKISMSTNKTVIQIGKTTGKVTATKGTIPHLFEKQWAKIKSQRSTTIELDRTNFAKKGTIPYYFSKKDVTNTSTNKQVNQLFREQE